MELNLHANATTTPRVRAYIQRSKKKIAELATELGVSQTTIRRWRSRTTIGDRSHTPKNLKVSLSPEEEALVCELRTCLQLPLDDIAEVMRRCVNGTLSRSAIHRCLKRHGLSQRRKPDKPAVGVFQDTTVGFIHIDLKHLPALERRKSYAFVAIDRVTRYVYIEIHPKRDAQTSEQFLKRFLAHFPHPVHTILTDNGSEFTDRFAVDKKNKPADKPSGQHPFDLLCAKQGINIASPDPTGRKPTAWLSASIAESWMRSAASPNAASRDGYSAPTWIAINSSTASSRITTVPVSNASTISPRSKPSLISRDQTRSRA
jgi:transposase-like protein